MLTDIECSCVITGIGELVSVKVNYMSSKVYIPTVLIIIVSIINLVKFNYFLKDNNLRTRRV
jgi:hypothetical protein